MTYLAAALSMGRQMAEAKMRDKCRITRSAGRVWDDASGQYTESETTVYDGPCSLLSPYRVPSSPDAAGQIQNVENLRLSLPVATSTGIHTGDTVDYYYAESDPDLTGRTFTVSSVAQQSDATARRLPVKEVS